MSIALAREADAGAVDTLPDRPISPRPNFVTQTGLAKIDARLRDLQAARADALAADDRSALASIERDLRYWKQRRSSARIIAPPAAPEIVRIVVEEPPKPAVRVPVSLSLKPLYEECPVEVSGGG